MEAGQAVIVQAGERVQYSTPMPQGAEYVAVCISTFSPEADIGTRQGNSR